MNPEDDLAIMRDNGWEEIFEITYTTTPHGTEWLAILKEDRKVILASTNSARLLVTKMAEVRTQRNASG